MPKLHSLELVPDDAGRAEVRGLWNALRDAGLPSQADHTGASNQPHVTVVEAAELPDAAIDVARARLRGMLPVTATARGILLLGRDRVTVALGVDLDDDLVRRVLAVRVQVPDRAHRGWLPHVTLARRVPRDRLVEALDVVGTPELELRLTEVRRWDPDRGHTTTL
jgi:2'-5' RNA ligase